MVKQQLVSRGSVSRGVTQRNTPRLPAAKPSLALSIARFFFSQTRIGTVITPQPVKYSNSKVLLAKMDTKKFVQLLGEVLARKSCPENPGVLADNLQRTLLELNLPRLR